MEQPDAKDFREFCKPYTVLPDFWKFWAVELKIDMRFASWRLDFNADGNLAQNFVAHGAPALMNHDNARHLLVPTPSNTTGISRNPNKKLKPILHPPPTQEGKVLVDSNDDGERRHDEE